MNPKTLHDIRNELTVAMATIHLLIDGHPASPSQDRLDVVLGALERTAALLGSAAQNGAAPGDELSALVVDAAPGALLLVDERGTIRLVNAQCEHLFGCGRAEMLGRPVETFVPHGLQQAETALVAVRGDGSEMPVEIALRTLRFEGADFVLAAIADVGERRRAEELRLLNLELANASRFKSQFVATMSHELRTPLTSIVGSAELLAAMDLGERAREHVAAIEESAGALLSLAGGILDLSKVEAGKMELREAPFVVGDVIASAAELLGPMARKKNLTIFTAVDGAIPPVAGDADRLRQILVNLIGNAVKFTERGDVRVSASLVEPGSPALVCFEVADTGCGIDAAALARLFEPFAQADEVGARRICGSGLGLWISKNLANLMHGEIGVESTPGAGSRFWFTARFPLVASDAGAPLPTLPVSPAPPLPTDLPVLVAEDDRRLQRLLQLQFEELGMPVTFVSDGLAAVEAVLTGNYALAFMDCRMPELDGITATKTIRVVEALTGRHVPIVAMTANAFAEDRDACLGAGMDDYLPKPVRLTDLRAALERWLVSAPLATPVI